MQISAKSSVHDRLCCWGGSMNAAEIRRNYFDKLNSLNMNQMDMWKVEEEITDTLYEKGYGLVNVCIAPCEYGVFNALDCDTSIAEKLASQIQDNGFEIILRKNPSRKSISWIIFPYNLVIEIKEIVDSFEVIS